MTAEEVAAPAETRKEEVNKSDKNMFDRVKERFSKRNKKKIEEGDEKKEMDNMTEINLSEKELLEKDSDEKKITEDKNTIEKKPEKKITGIEKVKELLKGSKETKVESEENKSDESPAIKKSTTLERVKERLSTRKLKKEKKESPESGEEQEEETVVEKFSNTKIDESSVNGNVIPADDEVPESKKTVDNDNLQQDENNKKKSGTLDRVKERLSMRKNKKAKVEEPVKDNDDIAKSENNSSRKDSNIDNNEAVGDQPEQETKDEKVKTETFLQRLLRLFRSKKKKNKDGNDAEDEANGEHVDEEKCEVDLSDEDKEVLAICGEDKNEPQTVPSITTTKPPLPVSRRLPSSATTAHTRPMSQLDDALKQFKLSTAASRENLRNSRQDLNQMEEQVKVAIRSRPATPLLSLKDRIQNEDNNKMSSSLTDLRS